MGNYDKFIGKLYDILLDSNIISYEDKPKDLKEKKERLEKYLDKLDRVQSKAMSKEEHIETLKRLYYDRYVIKKENIPEGYFKSLEKRYLDEGHGHHNLVNPDNEIDKELKEQHINVIIREQKDSLDVWLNYFFSEDSDYLPMWAKVWAFQGMLGIGNLNKEKDGYGRRSNTSVNPFVSLDAEILGKCVELVKATFENKEVTDKEIDKLVASGSFAKLYGKLLANKKELKVVSDEGIWIKYNYETEEQADKKFKDGIEPEYLKLYNSLQGYNTGWCTAGSKETAKGQICGGSYPGGDFYVYYTKDKNNEYKIPRIAIRMNKNSIGEIRGIAEGQNIESNMESVLEEKLKEFPDGKLYQKKVSDMKMLTKIYDNYKKRELTKEELMFLYELNGQITGFGYEEDPRINEILDRRDKRKDLSVVFDCEPSQIGLNYVDLLDNQLVYFDNSIDIELYKNMKKLGFNLPKYINGSLILYDLTSAEGLILPENINGSLILTDLTFARELVFPQHVGGTLKLDGLTSAKDIVLPKSVGGDLKLNSLKWIGKIKLPQNIGGSLYLSSLTSPKDLTLPENIGGSLVLENLTTAQGLEFPQIINGDLDLESLISAEGLILPSVIKGELILSSLTSAKDLKFPEDFKGSIDLSGLTTAEDLILPNKIGGFLDIRNLTSLRDLLFPIEIKSGVFYKYNRYELDQLYYIKQSEINRKTIRRNRRGFTTGIFTITFVLIITILSIVIAILIVNR